MIGSNVFRHGVIWFGAAISVAEIEAGRQMGGNWEALVAGHVVGGILLFAAGLLGARTHENAMQTTKGAFGSWGMRLLAVLNVIQLIGWTTVMISQGAAAVTALSGFSLTLCAVALAILVAGWILIGMDDSFHLATIGMVLLAALSAFLTFRLVGVSAPSAAPAEPMAFWPAFEVSVAMPLSWLPLISDYTSRAEKPLASTAVSALVYTVVSCWMYALGALLFSNDNMELTAGILKCGLGVIGLIIVVLSTVTTTFLDAYSAGESSKALSSRINPKVFGIAVCVLGAVLAVSGVVDRYIDFLYLIASVFAPMAAVLVVNVYIVKRPCVVQNIVAWLLGTVTYHFAGNSPIGPTLTSLLVAGLLAFVPLLRMRVQEKVASTK